MPASFARIASLRSSFRWDCDIFCHAQTTFARIRREAIAALPSAAWLEVAIADGYA
jgi:hypothetical protein